MQYCPGECGGGGGGRGFVSQDIARPAWTTPPPCSSTQAQLLHPLPTPTHPPPLHTTRHASVLVYHLVDAPNASGRIAQIAARPCIMDALLDRMSRFDPEPKSLNRLAVKCVEVICRERAGAEAVLRAQDNEGFDSVATCMVGFRFINLAPAGHMLHPMLEAQFEDRKASFLKMLQALARAAPQRVMLRAMRVPGFLEKMGELLETDTPYVRASAVMVRHWHVPVNLCCERGKGAV